MWLVAASNHSSSLDRNIRDVFWDCAGVHWHMGCQEEFKPRVCETRVSCSGRRTTAVDPRALGGAQCGEQRGPDLEHSGANMWTGSTTTTTPRLPPSLRSPSSPSLLPPTTTSAPAGASMRNQRRQRLTVRSRPLNINSVLGDTKAPSCYVQYHPGQNDCRFSKITEIVFQRRTADAQHTIPRSSVVSYQFLALSYFRSSLRHRMDIPTHSRWLKVIAQNMCYRTRYHSHMVAERQFNGAVQDDLDWLDKNRLT